MGYAKLFSSITESSLWSETKEARLLFVSMLARADATGFVEAALPGLARLANLTSEETAGAVTLLESPDPHSKNPDNDGRRITKVPGGWMILNYEEYRNRTEEQRRTYMREYMREYRKPKETPAPKTEPPVNLTVNKCKPALTQAEAEAEAEAVHTIKKKGASGEVQGGEEAAHPDLKEVLARASVIGLVEWRATDWFNEMEACGWLDNKKRPVRKWQPLLDRIRTYWEADGRPMTPPSRVNPKGVNGGPDIIEKELRKLERL